MARNEEKSHSMLNKWLEHKRDELQPGRSARRPGMTTDVTTVSECEKWRGQILKEIGRKVTEIQNASLPERRLRELNDDINKSLREKARWERRILDLGGPNYFATANRVREEEGGGVAVGGGKGEYKYFGEAKNLPEVRELIKRKTEQQEAKGGGHGPGVDGRRAHELHKGLDADYYGFRDEDDGLLPAEEAKAEARALARAQRDWQAAHPGQAPDAPADADEAALRLGLALGTEGAAEPLAPAVALPSREEIEAMLLARRKEELVRKYASPALFAALLESEADAKAQS